MAMQGHGTPGTPQFKIFRLNDENNIRIEIQFRYRSGIGMILHIIKHSRPNLVNVVRELSKYTDGALHLPRKWPGWSDFFLYSLNLKANIDDKNWDLVVYIDSDWAEDVENRISVTGFNIYLLGATICWRSKTQKSDTVRKWSEVFGDFGSCQRDPLHLLLAKRNGNPSKLPIMVRTDNIGAMFMA
jgi:hypothetical protein